MISIKWLESYEGQNTEELLALEKSYRTDSLIRAFDQALQDKAATLDWLELSQAEQDLLTVEELRREMENGGFYDYLYNVSEHCLRAVVEALLRIGCPQTAGLTLDAIKALNIAGELTSESVDQALECENSLRDEKLAACDSLFHSAPENLDRALFAFIKANRHQIILN